jgi:hypothetical protein
MITIHTHNLDMIEGTVDELIRYLQQYPGTARVSLETDTRRAGHIDGGAEEYQFIKVTYDDKETSLRDKEIERSWRANIWAEQVE